MLIGQSANEDLEPASTALEVFQPEMFLEVSPTPPRSITEQDQIEHRKDKYIIEK